MATCIGICGGTFGGHSPLFFALVVLVQIEVNPEKQDIDSLSAAAEHSQSADGAELFFLFNRVWMAVICGRRSYSNTKPRLFLDDVCESIPFALSHFM